MRRSSAAFFPDQYPLISSLALLNSRASTLAPFPNGMDPLTVRSGTRGRRAPTGGVGSSLKLRILAAERSVSVCFCGDRSGTASWTDHDEIDVLRAYLSQMDRIVETHRRSETLRSHRRFVAPGKLIAEPHQEPRDDEADAVMPKSEDTIGSTICERANCRSSSHSRRRILETWSR
jgi:hypothetical protein